MACFHQLHLTPIRSTILRSSQSTPTPKCPMFRCLSASISNPKRSYNITLLPGDGIGPEVISVAKDVLSLTASLEGISLPLSLGFRVLSMSVLSIRSKTEAFSANSHNAVDGFWFWDVNGTALPANPKAGILRSVGFWSLYFSISTYQLVVLTRETFNQHCLLDSFNGLHCGFYF